MEAQPAQAVEEARKMFVFVVFKFSEAF